LLSGIPLVLKKDFFSLLLLFVLGTIPLLFGGRHPLIHGGYSFVLLVACGSWLILNSEQAWTALRGKKSILAVGFLSYLFATSFSLPPVLIGILSPVRAEYLRKAAQTLQADPVTAVSYYAPDTRFLAMYLAALLFYFICASTMLRKDAFLTAALWVITSVGIFEAAYGLLQAMNPSLGVLWLPSIVGAEGCARGTIIYRNQYAALLNMCWPIALVLGLRLYRQEKGKATDRKKKKIGMAALAQHISLGFRKATLPLLGSAFMILAVIFSRSRGGIVVLMLIAAIILTLLPLPKRIKGLSSGIILLFTLVYGGMIGFHKVIDRFLVFYESALSRAELWLESLSMLKDHLVTGIGLGAYQYVSPVYLHTIPSTAWYDYAHNEYVELAIELGMPVMLLLLSWIIWGMGASGVRVIRAARQARALNNIPDKHFVAISSYCALLGFLLHGFVDFIWRLPVNSFYAVTLLALLSTATAPDLADGQTEYDRIF